MTLTQRTFLTVVSTFIALFFILGTFADIILLKSFTALERIVVTDNVTKVRNEVDHSYQELNDSLQELSASGSGRLPPRLNKLSGSFLLSRHIDILACFSQDDQLLASRIAEGRGYGEGLDERRYFDKFGEVVQLAKKASGGLLSGLFLLDDEPVHVVVARVPENGLLLMAGRYLDEEEVARLAEHADFTLELLPVAGKYAVAEAPNVLAKVDADNDTAVIAAGSDSINGYSLVRDVFGSPALLVKITENRTLYKQGIVSILYLMASVVVVGVVFCGVMMFFIRETILNRLESIIKKVSYITSQGDVAERLPVSGKEDELDRLAHSVNSMLDSLQKAESVVRESEERYRMLFDRAPDAIFVIGIEGAEGGRVVSANQTAVAQHGYALDELIGMKIADLNTPDSNKIDSGVMAAIDSGEWVKAELWHQKKDGTVFPVEIHAGLIRMNGKKYVLGFERDITQRKITEESDQMHLERIRQLNDELSRNALSLAAANNELEAFNYSVSHDMRGPLTRISGYCQLLLENDSQLDPGAREYVTRIYESEIWLNDMIDSMLNLAQLSRTEIESQKVDLSAIVETVLQELSMENPGRTVRASVEPNVIATGDPSLLKTVLVNLVGNAWKYSSRRDDAFIEFGVEQTESGRVYYVRDNGAGFQMKDSDKLFRVFTRLHDSSQFNGTGIGLATVQRIIIRHGGKIWAEAEPDVGATFYFTLSE